jgi:hypothetical protein
MKKLALIVLALELAVCGCGNNTRLTTVTTTSTGNWEAQMIGGIGPASQLNFVTSFNVTSTTGFTPQPLDITGFGFFNDGACFATGNDAETETGTATLNTTGSGAVTGGLTFTVKSTTAPGTVLSLTSTDGLTGTSNGTTSTTGTLSNGIVVGTWSLSGSSDPDCTGSGTFIMCQGTSTCTPP